MIQQDRSLHEIKCTSQSEYAHSIWQVNHRVVVKEKQKRGNCARKNTHKTSPLTTQQATNFVVSIVTTVTKSPQSGF